MLSPVRIPFSTIETKFVSIKGHRIRYLTGGAGPPLVLVHGLLGYSFCFRFNLEELARHSTFYALDLPGTGFSSREPEIRSDLESLAEFLLSFIEQLGLKKPTLLGSSHGGAIVLFAASLARERRNPLGPLILVSPVNPWSRFGRRRAAIIGSAPGSLVFRCISPAIAPLHGYFLSRMYGNPAALTRETINGYSAAIRQRGTITHLLGRVRQWGRDLDLLKPEIQRCKDLPVLLIWGDRDRAVDPGSAQPLMRVLPRAKLAVIPGAGHLPFEEAPAEFNQIVLDFLAHTHSV